MTKLIAVLNVIAWSGFWAFGYLALTSQGAEPRQMVIAALLAAAGFLTGLWAWSWLHRAAGDRGHRAATHEEPGEV